MSKDSKPTVTLLYDLVDDKYRVEQIRGNVVGIEITRTRDLARLTVRVGSVLTEGEATSLGRVANLTIKRLII